VAVVAIAGTIALSIFVFLAVAVAAMLVGGYLWWKTRPLRRQLRERQPLGGRIIEGEAIRESEPRRFE
jgi:hypothetical protein